VVAGRPGGGGLGGHGATAGLVGAQLRLLILRMVRPEREIVFSFPVPWQNRPRGAIRPPTPGPARSSRDGPRRMGTQHPGPQPSAAAGRLRHRRSDGCVRRRGGPWTPHSTPVDRPPVAHRHRHRRHVDRRVLDRPAGDPSRRRGDPGPGRPPPPGPPATPGARPAGRRPPVRWRSWDPAGGAWEAGHPLALHEAQTRSRTACLARAASSRLEADAPVTAPPLAGRRPGGPGVAWARRRGCLQ
jgi:hypothetical protein